MAASILLLMASMSSVMVRATAVYDLASWRSRDVCVCCVSFVVCGVGGVFQRPFE